ncbi:HAD family hydrolase [bacterium (Candidatus Blackallbacteria) CG17_big_fil_post_rev_8_21_14_2_50_48_46]|uniref:HAD family hydrolase n=1 Tax=bacterium (Candidatus Blackallbacteria) CG17_big_fil_post_rev_8_21_14_2_50_48_46 TaxID=2014261 RepID=A0A2M7GBS5_9BACT|nr:MAG: HAD family hydrolase [bacterium (Candidatus Blackallbacteria) CG18_big_fil_WC_8_21_14_2_50_49_26]PIW19662.1 MAG: HAD family hydrolase [bacterium (Candidatus Blackallbacteria) CG17_big_fil_post_rev_8_21_14_2_50_48_46]PIW44733.1 MAG: HAD family hydrolase [bacterium (Candidatus Blackallbacteria) CG13_big_fil_rev_8_21_14_2_50_49_14]
METLKRALRKSSPEKFRLLTELVETSIDGTRDIFVNRPLNMSQIHYIGFDMDYTLAIYNKRAIEELAFVKTLEKLVELRNYPEQILDLNYNDEAIIRGLLMDHQKGNLIKINRFKQVCRVLHGSIPLETNVYFNDKVDQSDPQRISSVDTLFSLPEAYLYTLLVDLVEAGQLTSRSYHEIYEDIRFCIDMTHRDGSLKSNILHDIAKYVYKDPHLSLTLDKFIESGKKLFLLTNSEFYYTDMIMEYLLDTDNLNYTSWRNYFEIVIVNARKPGFFKENTPFYEVDEKTHEETLFNENAFQADKIYSKGNYIAFESLIQAKGNEVLYIGDHIFGDVMRSDKDSNWRTVLVVQELEEELSKTEEVKEKLLRMRRLTNKWDKLHYELHIFSSQLNTLENLEFSLRELTPAESKALAKTREELEEGIRRCQKEMEKTETKIHTLRAEISAHYHPIWGPLFHDGDEISRFGDQVRDYASLYTSRVSNFFFYPIDRYYKSLRDIMPHDRWLELSN